MVFDPSAGGLRGATLGPCFYHIRRPASASERRIDRWRVFHQDDLVVIAVEPWSRGERWKMLVRLFLRPVSHDHRDQNRHSDPQDIELLAVDLQHC